MPHIFLKSKMPDGKTVEEHLEAAQSEAELAAHHLKTIRTEQLDGHIVILHLMHAREHSRNVLTTVSDVAAKGSGA